MFNGFPPSHFTHLEYRYEWGVRWRYPGWDVARLHWLIDYMPPRNGPPMQIFLPLPQCFHPVKYIYSLRPSDAYTVSVSKPDHHWFRLWLGADQAPSHIWTNAGVLSIGPLVINFSEILMEIQTFSLKKMHLKMLSVKWRPSCLSINVLSHVPLGDVAVILKVHVWFSNILYRKVA